MASSGFRVAGMRELQDKLVLLSKLAGQPSKPLASAGRRAWKPILDKAQEKCPVSMGPLQQYHMHLRDAIMITVKKPKRGDIVLRCGLKIKRQAKGAPQGVDYPRRRWHLVEFGTKSMSAKPFIRPAFDEAAHLCISVFRTELGRSVDRALRKKGVET